MNAYYNEHDPFAAAWLRRLIEARAITPGVVDERDIRDVQPADLRGYTRCHFFAGIGGWDHALNLAGWGDRPVWTGSCPCQPFSSAGKGEGFGDPRHLWPAWFRLVRECRPATVFGENVASKDGLAWFDHVSTDLEAEGYAVGAADLCAASVGAPHIRQRLFFVADATRERLSEPEHRGIGQDHPRRALSVVHGQLATRVDGGARAVADASDAGLPPREREAILGARGREEGRAATEPGSALGDPEHGGRAGRDSHGGGPSTALPSSEASPAGDPAGDGRSERGLSEHGDEQGAPGLLPDGPGTGGFWDGALWLPCRDGKLRPIPAQPALFPLASGIPNRVGTLRGSGNAIVPQAAAELIRAYVEAREGGVIS